MNMTTTTSAPFVMEYTEYKISIWLWRVCSPILLVFGTLGNSLSIAVLTRKSMSNLTISFYLIVLAANDILGLYIGLLRQWIKFTWAVDIRQLHHIVCKLLSWLIHFSVGFSSWILVMLTTERVLVVCFPLKLNYKCSKSNARNYLFIVGTLLLLATSHYLFMVGDYLKNPDSNYSTIIHCDYLSSDYKYFNQKIYPFIYLCIYSVIPFIFIITGNVAIIIKVCLGNRRRTQRSMTPNNVDARSSKTRSMTVMLLSANTVFLVCTLPICIFDIVETDVFSNVHVGYYIKAQKEMMYALVNIIMYTGNAVNFIIYSLSGTLFRKTLKSMIDESLSQSHPFTTDNTQ